MNRNNKVPNEFSVLVGMIKEYGFEKSYSRYQNIFKMGDFLRAVRIARGETQDYVAVRIEVDRVAVSKVELNMPMGGRHGANYRTVLRLKKYYNIKF